MTTTITNIDDLASMYGQSIVEWTMENFGTCNHDTEEEALAAVTAMLEHDYIGSFLNRSDAGEKLMQRMHPGLADALAEASPHADGLFNFAAYMTRHAEECSVHMHLGSDGRLHVFVIA